MIVDTNPPCAKAAVKCCEKIWSFYTLKRSFCSSKVPERRTFNSYYRFIQCDNGNADISNDFPSIAGLYTFQEFILYPTRKQY